MNVSKMLKILLTGHFFTLPVIFTGHIFTTSYQTKHVSLRIHYRSTMCIYDRSKPDFDRAKMKLTGHFDRIHFFCYFELCLHLIKLSWNGASQI